jgi:UDP-GlcNAc:undecaprenyl-phosphate/decaprenyl-phosphate GlcNAc-1-phosphate transferase
MLLLLILCAAASACACLGLMRLGRRNARRYGLSMPQRFHVGHVPRLGGVAMYLASALGWVWMAMAERYLPVTNGIVFSLHSASAWIVTVGLAVFAGAVEDVTHRVRARWRLILTFVASLAAVWLLDLRIDRLGIAWIDATLQGLPWLGVAFALVALAGLPHAFNLIDGYNGLAGMVGVICSFALAYVCLLVGDRQLAGIAIVSAGATAGFLLWNYPRGFIFAGDGGAYLWGTVIAITSISLVQRHAAVSPWFPALLLIYPVWETLFSIYRKAARGQSPSMADALHFHQLIYRRVVRQVFEDDEARRMLMRNNRTSPYLWSFTLLTVIPAVIFWQSTRVLIAFCALFVASYIYAYVSIVRFKVPNWVRR